MDICIWHIETIIFNNINYHTEVYLHIVGCNVSEFQVIFQCKMHNTMDIVQNFIIYRGTIFLGPLKVNMIQ